jgi:hypothetical protein
VRAHAESVKAPIQVKAASKRPVEPSATRADDGENCRHRGDDSGRIRQPARSRHKHALDATSPHIGLCSAV